MKDLITLALAASLVSGVAASSHHGHQHLHRHARRQQLGSNVVEKRAVVTAYVAAYESKYVDQNGKEVNEGEAQKCIANGICSVVGSKIPTLEPPPPPSTTSTTSTLAAAFFEAKTSAAPTTTSEPPPPPPPTTSAEPSKTEPEPKKGSSSGGSGVDRDFPSGLPCSTFPSEYGAVPADWLGIGGWTTIAQLGRKSLSDLSVPFVGTFAQAIKGECTNGDQCSYACPPGYDKTQWPEDGQAVSGASLGGLACIDNKLVLTRPSHKKLCAKGAGRVKVVNKCKKVVSICKTDYPGDERMSVPYEFQPGDELPLYNPRAKDTYVWKGSKTTSQYYINPEGLSKEKACIWGTEFDNFGNFAPTNLGVGTNDKDETFIGLFRNDPSTKFNLDFDVHIVVNGQTTCSVKDNKYTGSDKGCTASVMSGQEATIYLLEKGASP